MGLMDTEFERFNGFYFIIEFISSGQTKKGSVVEISFREAEGKPYPIYEVRDEEGKFEITNVSPYGKMPKFLEWGPGGKENLVRRLKEENISLDALPDILPEGAEEAIEEIKREFEQDAS